MTTGIVLKLAGLRRHFRGVRAIDGVDLEVQEGQILGLIGPNGAGKSTLFRLIAGLIEADAGRTLLRGRELTHLPPEERVRLGLGWSFQHARCYPELTVRQHLEVALTSSPGGRETLDSHLAAFGLLEQADCPAGVLSLAQRKLLDVARATCRKPELVLLDEPFAGLGRREADLLHAFLAELRHAGTVLIVIEHRLGELLDVVDEIAVLAAGRIIHRGSPRATLESRRVLRTYFGIDDEAPE